MAMTITNRMVMYVGGFRQDMFRGESTGTTDDTRGRMVFIRGGCSIAPISASTGAGDMTVTWTTVTGTALGASRGLSLISISNSASTEVGSLIAWGW